MPVHQLVYAWRQCPLTSAPFLLPQDSVLLDLQYDRCVTTCTSFDEYIRSDAFGQESDHTAHLGLIPTPYMGDLSRADIFVLMMNPGLSAADYYAEEHDAALQSALECNLRQQRLDRAYPFIWLNPAFAFHGGFRFWEGKQRRSYIELRGVVASVIGRHLAFSPSGWRSFNTGRITARHCNFREAWPMNWNRIGSRFNTCTK
ncbi:MAG TPA: hypothetical protein VGL38_09505 [bacterium]